MKRQKQLNEAVLIKARKEREKVLKLKEKINKTKSEIEDIKEENRWMRYLSSDFCVNATEEQQIEFANEFNMIK